MNNKSKILNLVKIILGLFFIAYSLYGLYSDYILGKNSFDQSFIMVLFSWILLVSILRIDVNISLILGFVFLIGAMILLLFDKTILAEKAADHSYIFFATAIVQFFIILLKSHPPNSNYTKK